MILAATIATAACGGRIAFDGLDTLGDQSSRGTGEGVDASTPTPTENEASAPTPTPAPTPSPTPTDAGSSSSARIVFITGPAPPYLPIGEADALCQAEGAAAGWKGIFRAWLSDGVTSPAARFDRSTIPYRTPLGQVVAASWGDLTTKPLAHPIDQSADGGEAWMVKVWTGTAPDGTDTGVHCGPGGSATIGNVHSTSAAWTADFATSCGGGNAVLYCFEQ